jgi:CHAT domain-containing protein
LIDFNLGLIEGKAGVLVYASAGPDGSLGQAWRPLEPDELNELEQIRRQAETATAASLALQVETRDIRPTATASLSREKVDGHLTELGQVLFRIVVQDEILEVYEHARSAALDGQRTMLLVLKLRERSSLQLVPWEILHDGRRFLAKDPRTAIVRYFEQPVPVGSLEIKPPLRVLVTLASPKDLPPLALEEEVAALREAYKEMGRLVVPVVKRNISLEELENVWHRAGNTEKPFHVWHHCGHGGWQSRAGQERYVLSLESQGRSQPVEVDQLKEIVGFCPGLRIAVFNVCHSGASTGVVPALAHLNVPVVIGFQQAVRDPAAARFAAVLHRNLLHIPVEFAVSQARSSISIHKLSFDWAHALAFSRRRDRGTLLPRPARREAMQRAASELRKQRGSIKIEVDSLTGNDNQVVGVNSLGGKSSDLREIPDIHMKAREISGKGVRLVGFQMINGFSDSDIQAREVRAEQLLTEIDHLVGQRAQP